MPTKNSLKEKLTKPFPEEAKQKKEYGGFKASGYNPAYVTERLNEVFGYDGWEAKLEKFRVVKGDNFAEGSTASTEVLLSDKYAVVLVRLSVGHNVVDPENPNEFKEKEAVRYQFGTCNITDKGLTPGEAMKGAFTDALKKCAAYLDIGNDAYKGEVEVGYKKADERPKQRGAEETGKGKGPEGYQELIDRIDGIVKRMNMPTEELDAIAVECGAVDYAAAIPEHLEAIVKILGQRWNEWQKAKRSDKEKKEE